MRVSSNRRPRGGRSSTGNNRTGGNTGRAGSGGNRRSNNGNRNYESNGPDGKIRGTASQVYEKYIALATDAQTSGDRVAAENYFQHGEHYFRIVAANNLAKQEKQVDQPDFSNTQPDSSSYENQPQPPYPDPGEVNGSGQAEDSNDDSQPSADAGSDRSDNEQSSGDDDVQTIEISRPDESENDDQEKPKRRTSRTRTLRRRTSSRSDNTDDKEEVNTSE